MQIHSETSFNVHAEDGDLMLLVAVQVPQGILCTGVLIDAYDPGATGALAGTIGANLALNAPQFPGDDSTPRTADRTVQVGPSSIEVLTVEFIPEDAPALAASTQ